MQARLRPTPLMAFQLLRQEAGTPLAGSASSPEEPRHKQAWLASHSICFRCNGLTEAVAIAQRTHHIARQSIVVGLGLSGIAMAFAAFGLIPPVAGALLQEGIDIAVILNALRTLAGPKEWRFRLAWKRRRFAHDRRP